jgi:putative oxidoreductase
LGLVLFAEVGCSLLIMLGFKTRWATIPLVITMLVAAFYAHAADPFGKKELSLLFFTLFLSILISGGGRFSLDGLIRGKKKNRWALVTKTATPKFIFFY